MKTLDPDERHTIVVTGLTCYLALAATAFGPWLPPIPLIGGLLFHLVEYAFPYNAINPPDQSATGHFLKDHWFLVSAIQWTILIWPFAYLTRKLEAVQRVVIAIVIFIIVSVGLILGLNALGMNFRVDSL